MPGFLFDTNVLIDYLHDDHSAKDAIVIASEVGHIFISKVSVLELWASAKWKISEKSANLVPRWVRRLNEGELPLGIIELIEDNVEEYNIGLPSHPQVEVLREDVYWVIVDENQRTMFQIQHQNGTMTIGYPDRRREEIEEEVRKIYDLSRTYNAKIVNLSVTAQHYAEILIKYHYRTLGKNAVTDVLIISTGLARRAWLITNETSRWSKIARDLEQRRVGLPGMKVITPEQVVQEFAR